MSAKSLWVLGGTIRRPGTSIGEAPWTRNGLGGRAPRDGGVGWPIGWPRPSRHTSLNVDQVRTVIGGLFLGLAVLYLLKASRDLAGR